jgi:hypothetical protein
LEDADITSRPAAEKGTISYQLTLQGSQFQVMIIKVDATAR